MHTFKIPKKADWNDIESEVVRVKNIYGLAGLPSKKTTGLRGKIKTTKIDKVGLDAFGILANMPVIESSEFELEIISAVGGDFAMLSAVNLKFMEGVVVAVSPLDDLESQELCAAISAADNNEIIRIVASANVYTGNPPLPVTDDDELSSDYGDD